MMQPHKRVIGAKPVIGGKARTATDRDDGETNEL